MNRDYDAHTHPNQTRPGIPPSWRNANGSRPRNPLVVERDRRVADLRVALIDNPDMTLPSVMLRYGLKRIKTAVDYLARAKGAK